jgi:phenylpropionate dioxygenase-like ring-hydroxylating dioxygenase large terminal subunit
LLNKLPEPWVRLPRQWIYMGLFPNTVIAMYPDSVIFYQDIPLGVGETAVRGGIYARPGEDRVTRLARKLSMRIDLLTAEEDKMLTVWSQEAIQSSAFDGIILSDLEAGVRSHHDKLREVLPVTALANSPAPGTLSRVNAEFSKATY